MMKKDKKLGIALITTLLFVPLNTLASTKSETIYTNLNYDGTVEQTQVSAHLSFVGDDYQEDETILESILNINGDEDFSQNDTKLTWKTDGNDIFYKGKTDKSLPIRTDIKYYLDDKEEKLDDMIGKSGHIKIVYSFINADKKYASINGYMETIYTPYLTTVGTIIKDGAKNITVTNGKIVSTGSRTTVLGFASPGLYASTKISNFKNFDKVTIEFDTEKFELGTTYIVSTPKILDEIDTNIFEKINSLSTNMSELETSMTKLENGAKELQNGATTLADGSDTLTKSINKVKTSMQELKNGSVSLDVGITQILEALNTTKSELQSQESLNKLTQLNLLHEQNAALITRLAIALQSTGLTTKNLQNSCLTQDALYQSNEDVQLFCLLNANNKAIEGSIDTSQDIVNKIDALTTGVESLKEGSLRLSSGLTAMNTGIDQIYEGSKTLSAGTETLKKGATTLSAGTTQFKEQGIEKLVTYANEFKTYSRRTEELIKMSKNYKGFSSSNTDETIFISMVKSYR